jgi:predicted DNA-binding transcriptional regulator AlpA
MAKFIRFPAVKKKTGGLCRTTIWRLEHEGDFPKRRALTPRVVVWDEAEVDKWIRTHGTGYALVPGTRKADMPVRPNKRSDDRKHNGNDDGTLKRPSRMD